MPHSAQKSERKSSSKSVDCRRKSRRHRRSSSSRCSSSSSSSSDSDRSRHHRRHRHHHKKPAPHVQEALFKECTSLVCPPEGNLGPVYLYTLDEGAYSIPVLGFVKGQNGQPDQPADLFAKKSCSAKGLGLAQTPENGINQNVYVQFDMTQLVNDPDVDTFQLCLNLLDCSDVVEVYGSNSAGSLGKRLMKSDGKEKKLQLPLNDNSCCENKNQLYNFIAVTLHERKCSNKLGFLVECICLYHRKPQAYAAIHTDQIVSIPLGSPIPFQFVEQIRGFQYIDSFTLRCLVKGIYAQIMTVDTLEPNSCAVYVNGVRAGGTWFGANATAQDIGNGMLKLKVGDLIQLINQSSQGGTITLSPLGSGANNSVGQNTAAFCIWRVD